MPKPYLLTLTQVPRIKEDVTHAHQNFCISGINRQLFYLFFLYSYETHLTLSVEAIFNLNSVSDLSNSELYPVFQYNSIPILATNLITGYSANHSISTLKFYGYFNNIPTNNLR